MRFGKPTKNVRKNNPKYFVLNEDVRFENNSSKNMHDVQFYLEEFYPFAKEALGFDKDATVVFESDLANAKNPLGKTAHYDPSSSTVTVYVDKRHPKDVMRSVSHELVHHAQNLRGDLNGGAMEEGYAQSDDHLRKMEEEAYHKGNMIFRDWTDTRNNPEDQKNVMSRLMQEWGYDDSALEEEASSSKNFEEGQLVVVVASALAVDGEKTGTVVKSDDKSVTIKLDDDQEGKYVPEDKMVRVKIDYVEPRVEAGDADIMGETEEVNEMYDDDYDDFDMDSLEDEFPWLKKDMGGKKGAPPADVVADLDAEFGDMMEPEEEEEEEITVMKEGGSMAEYGAIDAQDGNPPSKIGRGNPEYMEAYNAVLVARGEEPLDIQQPDQAYLDALHSGRLEEGGSMGGVQVGDKVTLKGQKNLWTVQEVFPSGEVVIKSDKTGFNMTVNPADLSKSIQEESFRFSDEEKAMLDKMSKKEFSDYVTKGRHTTPDLKGDMGELPGMEGPFQYKSGAVLYYDTKTGEYYDRGQDRYLDRDEAAELTMEKVDRKKAAWMKAYDDAAGNPQPKPRDFWDTATFLYNKGEDPVEAGQRYSANNINEAPKTWAEAGAEDAKKGRPPSPPSPGGLGPDRQEWNEYMEAYKAAAGQTVGGSTGAHMNEMEGDGDGWGEIHGNASEEAPTMDAAVNALSKLDKTIESYLQNVDKFPQYETDARDLQEIRGMFWQEIKNGATPGNFSQELKDAVAYLDTIVRDAIPQDLYYSLHPEILENKKMSLEEMVRQAVRKALTEKKYRREDEEEEEVNEFLSGKINKAAKKVNKRQSDSAETLDALAKDAEKDDEKEEVEEMKYRREDEDSEEKKDLEEGNQESRTITQIEKIGDEVSNLAGMVTDPAVAERLEMVDQMVTDLLGQMQGVEPMGMEEAESTEKHDDDPALKGDQDELPDHLQKAIIDDEEENVDEETNKEWYDSSLFESLMKKWVK